jgi:tRNA U34 2-thiouridine synthase MnmA/TrmU
MLTERGHRLEAIFFKLPFASPHPGTDPFLKNEEVPLTIMDCTRGELFSEYLEVLKKPIYGRGVGYNPCTDCKIFMVQHAVKYALANRFDALATGEVPGQRPMSQTMDKMERIREHTQMELIRPLEEAGIKGRKRKDQMKIAKSYSIPYPSPAGGCLLCEREVKTRLQTLIEHNVVTENTLSLLPIGRHFYIEKNRQWFVVGRNKQENKIIEQYHSTIQSGKGKPAVYYRNTNERKEPHNTALKLQQAYQDKDQQAIGYFSTWKI